LNAKEWIIRPPWPGCREAAIKLGVSETVAQVLYNRGIRDVSSARQFLNPKLSDLQEPHCLPDLSKAARRLAEACKSNQRIVVYSDYDVDGVAGAAVLWHVLSHASSNLDFYIPHRLEEGYGLNTEAITRLAEGGADLVVTVDCGIRAHEPAKLAKQHGLDLVITDHHEEDATLPDAVAVVRPNQDPQLAKPCGATVAFKLAWAVARQLCGGRKVDQRFRQSLLESTALVALATVADVVPLVGENRILAHYGLKQLARTQLVGLQALLEHSGLKGDKIHSYHVGFMIGPRLNAAGRMGHARLALELLTRADPQRADELADYLDRQNRQRQSLESRILQEAVGLAQQRGYDDPSCPMIVLAQQGWHAGVIGIVAAKLVDRFHKPVVLIALDEPLSQGSGRSIEGFDIHQAVAAAGKWLHSFGGHAMAAGLRIAPSNVEPFTEALIDYAAKTLDTNTLAPKLHIDAVVDPAELNLEFVGQLQRLGPFGHGNPRPILATQQGQLVGEPKTMGKTGRHLSFTIRLQDRLFRAVGFNFADIRGPLLDHRRCRLAFNPTVNEYNGSRSVELRICDVKIP